MRNNRLSHIVKLGVQRMVVVLFAVGAVIQFGATRSLAASESGASIGPEKPLQLITVPENEPWLLLAAAPAAAQILSQNRVPVVLSVSSDHAKEQRRLIDRLKPFAFSCSILSQNPYLDLYGTAEEVPVRVQAARPSLTQASIKLAKSFWKNPHVAVVTSTDDPAMGILASTLAAHLKAPFIPFKNQRDFRELSKALDSMGVSTALLALGIEDYGETAVLSVRYGIEYIDQKAVNDRIVSVLEAGAIRNVILAREPDREIGEGAQSWIAPYLSVVRGAPLILCPSSDGAAAEVRVNDFIARYGLQPRTVTILGDHSSIGTISVTDSELLGEYEVSVEPCSGSLGGGAAAMGVGRIPSAELWASSTLIAGTIAREPLLGQVEPGVLLIGNPHSQYGSLPLAETVSRLTAEEFRNLGVEIKDFYRLPTNDANCISAAEKAQLIIYEGHVTDQLLLQDPCSTTDYYEEGYYEDDYYSHGNEPISDQDEFYESNLLEDDSAFAGETVAREDYGDVTHWSSDEPCPAKQDMYGAELSRNNMAEKLDGMPLVVLQSCHSLEKPTADQIFRIGGVGVVGSVTNVYSASGSAFVKAFCDGLIYRGDTVGEALRDARNYFISLAILKARRGHKETAKVNRAALSFCLWGDPELRLFSQPLVPKRTPVSAAFKDSETVIVSTPKHRLPEQRSEKYVVRMFPASQAAGVVKSLKNGEARRLMAFYFFRLPLPAGFNCESRQSLVLEDGPTNRAVFLTDAFRRFVYLLYFPEKEPSSNAFALQFSE